MGFGNLGMPPLSNPFSGGSNTAALGGILEGVGVLNLPGSWTKNPFAARMMRDHHHFYYVDVQ